MAGKRKCRKSRRRAATMNSAANYAVKGMVDMTKIGVAGAVGIGLIGAVGNAFKQG